MKKVFLIGLSVFCISAMFVSCNKEDVTADNEMESQVIKFEVEDVDVSKLNKTAVARFDNIKKIVFATGINKSNSPVTKSGEVEEPTIADLFVEKLSSLDIVEDESTEQISFFDMDENEQEVFLENWAILQAEQLSEKFLAEPELEMAVKAENEAIESVLDEEVVEVKSGNYSVKDKNAFFAKLEERLSEKEKQLQEQIPDTKAIGLSTSSNAIDFTKLRSALRSYARVGDILVALPMHNRTYVWLDLGNDQFKVGHAGIITAIPAATADEYTNIVIAAGTSGVGNENLKYWSYKCYIAGLQKVKWVWKWRGFKSGFYKEVSRVSNPATLASWGTSYKGRPYVRWYEFLTAKWAAPSRFTCTTLVWWCAGKAYDINVSEWYKTLVTPAGLLTDESVYIRCDVH
jgi:hypothetical protein